MATPDEQWWDAQAGEYVIGTLRGAERDVFEKILKVDETAQERVFYWQEVLSALDKDLGEDMPPKHIYREILARIRTQQKQPLSKEASVHTFEPNTVENNKQNTVWKGLAAFATAATLIMAAFLFNALTPSKETDTRIIDAISIIKNEENDPIWVLNADTRSNNLYVIALSPPTIKNDQSHQLWMVKPNDSGVEPVALLPSNSGESITVELPIPIDETQLFAVSLEPSGGSPNATPSGPVVFTGSIISAEAP